MKGRRRKIFSFFLFLFNFLLLFLTSLSLSLPFPRFFYLEHVDYDCRDTYTPDGLIKKNRDTLFDKIAPRRTCLSRPLYVLAVFLSKLFIPMLIQIRDSLESENVNLGYLTSSEEYSVIIDECIRIILQEVLFLKIDSRPISLPDFYIPWKY